MNKKTVFYVAGRLMLIMAGILIVPLGIGIYYHPPADAADLFNDPEKFGFLLAIIFSALAGLALSLTCRSKSELEGIREGFTIVTVAWVALGFIGAIPFFVYFMSISNDYSLANIILTFTDGYFESSSGFTTTGSSILSNIEALPKGLLFWRSLTHWLGGMGIITLAIAIFPAMGVSGYHMFKGEVPGPTTERIQPRLAETAAILWGVYALLSLVEAVLLVGGGMNWFDSLCHTFGTMATGGFSTQNGSIGQYNSHYFDWIITIFMFLAGVNFLIHYQVIRGNFSDLFTNREFLFYTKIIIIAIIVFTGILYLAGIKPVEQAKEHFQYQPIPEEQFVEHVAAEGEKVSTLYGAFRQASFQTLAIVTTTGYGTADFDLWPDFIRFGLLFLMFCGGCAGSTGGGMKMIRVLVIFKTGWRELLKMIRPHLIAPLKIGGASMSEDRVVNIVAFFIMFMALFVIGSLLMTLFIPDLVTSIAAVAASLGNIGPGLCGVGSTQNYGWIPVPGKWILIIFMLLGRLEIFTILIALRPATWKK